MVAVKPGILCFLRGRLADISLRFGGLGNIRGQHGSTTEWLPIRHQDKH
jgi:hypothetical protein